MTIRTLWPAAAGGIRNLFDMTAAQPPLSSRKPNDSSMAFWLARATVSAVLNVFFLILRQQSM